MTKIAQQSDIIRKLFLEKQLAIFPIDIINIIRNYDPIFRDQFTNKVLKNLTKNVYDFWHSKMVGITDDPNNVYGDFEVFISKIDYYYEILSKILVVPPNIKYKF